MVKKIISFITFAVCLTSFLAIFFFSDTIGCTLIFNSCNDGYPYYGISGYSIIEISIAIFALVLGMVLYYNGYYLVKRYLPKGFKFVIYGILTSIFFTYIMTYSFYIIPSYPSITEEINYINYEVDSSAKIFNRLIHVYYFQYGKYPESINELVTTFPEEWEGSSTYPTSLSFIEDKKTKNLISYRKLNNDYQLCFHRATALFKKKTTPWQCYDSKTIIENDFSYIMRSKFNSIYKQFRVDPHYSPSIERNKREDYYFKYEFVNDHQKISLCYLLADGGTKCMDEKQFRDFMRKRDLSVISDTLSLSRYNNPLTPSLDQIREEEEKIFPNQYAENAHLNIKNQYFDIALTVVITDPLTNKEYDYQISGDDYKLCANFETQPYSCISRKTAWNFNPETALYDKDPTSVDDPKYLGNTF